jgi:hypothetical protein
VDCNLAEDTIQILFDSAFGEVKVVGNLFVGLAMPDESDNLSFPDRQVGLQKLLLLDPRLFALRTNTLFGMSTKFTTAATTVLKRGEDGKLARHGWLFC